MKFKDLDLSEGLLEGLDYMGFVEATPIQEQAIPAILDNRDMLACAQTGTGKTGAFVLPVIHKLSQSTSNKTRALIICPTRELALQIDQQIQALGYFANVTSIPVYGGGDGHDWEDQRKALKKGTDFVVATPGKLLSHLKMGYVDFKHVEHFILDEADRMLDMGFIEDIEEIIKHLPKKRQNLLFSATMPQKIKKLAAVLLHDHVEIRLAISKPAAGILQAAYLAYDSQKVRLVTKLIKDKPKYERILIFSSTKKKVGEIVRSLKKNGLNAEGMSSDFEQKEREDVLNRFRSKETRIIVATDVLSRGIDIKDINLVVNYDVPKHAEDYVHRIGRTARASTTGVALTFINEDDMYKFKGIEDLIEKEVPKIPLPPELGEGPPWSTKPSHKRRSGGGGFKSKGKSFQKKGNRR